jgi:hypothetical protein
LTEWRIVALRAIELIIQAGTIGTDVLPELLLALDAGLNDYTITERGDVGSLVRTKAIQCVQRLWESGQPVLEPASQQLLQGNVIRLALEKMDRVRLQAAGCLAQDSESKRSTARFQTYPFISKANDTIVLLTWMCLIIDTSRICSRLSMTTCLSGNAMRFWMEVYRVLVWELRDY